MLTDADVDVCCAVSEAEDAEVEVELVVEVVVVAGVVASGVGVGVGVVGAAVVEGAAGAVVAPNVRPVFNRDESFAVRVTGRSVLTGTETTNECLAYVGLRGTAGNGAVADAIEEVCFGAQTTSIISIHASELGELASGSGRALGLFWSSDL